jgi:hypothetical protein
VSNHQTSNGPRTILVWMTSLFGILLVAWVALVFVLVWSGVARVETAPNVTLLDKVPTMVLGLIIVGAAAALLLLSGIARVLFLLALALDLAIAASHASQTGWFDEIWGPGSVLKLILHAYLIAACIYVWRLRVARESGRG